MSARSPNTLRTPAAPTTRKVDTFFMVVVPCLVVLAERLTPTSRQVSSGGPPPHFNKPRDNLASITADIPVIERSRRYALASPLVSGAHRGQPERASRPCGDCVVACIS